jgi:prepilin-type N-terminal cleavage/methylation domain-containing protein
VHRRSREQGFTVIELLIVVALMGVLLATAVPVFLSSRVKASEKTCYSNQRAVEGAVGMWLAASPASGEAALAGTVNGSHPLVRDGMLVRAPHCPAAPDPADELNPTPAEGAYVMGSDAYLDACPFGELGVHGHY